MVKTVKQTEKFPKYPQREKRPENECEDPARNDELALGVWRQMQTFVVSPKKISKYHSRQKAIKT